MEQGANPAHIAEALTTIGHPSAAPEQIHIANKYLADCETNSQFPLLLLEIYSQTGDEKLQLSSLLLLGNVIKRNWSNRGKGVQKSPMDKEGIKSGIMKACLLHNMQHYKHFNALLKTMTRHCYPSSYLELHQFVLNSLQQMTHMVETQPQAFLGHNFAAPVLSMLKTVMKEYSNKRISHNQDDFKNFIAPVVVKAIALAQAMQGLLAEAFKSSQRDTIVLILQFVRKVDKIALYSLLTMPSLYQSEFEISQIIKGMVVKLKEYDDTLALGLDDAVRDQIEKYIIGILQLVTKGQNSFPFLFTDFLQDYLALVLSMLLVHLPQGRYRSQKLLSVVVLANLKPINIYPYYTKPQDFRASIYCRKSPNSNNNEKQSHCYAVFQETYTPDMVKNMLIKLISEVMTLEPILEGQKQESSELILEDVEIAIVDQVSEPTPYDNCISLAKMIIKNFKDHCKPVLLAMFNELTGLQQQGRKGTHIIGNLMDVLLFLPVVMPENQLPLEQVQNMLNLMHKQGNFKFLARVIRKYFSFFDTKVQRECLDILVQIVSSPISDINSSDVVYQAALALKTVLSETYEFDGISSSILTPCIGNILTIMKNKQFVSNPTLLWPIINLIIKLLASLADSNAIENIAVMIVNGVSQLLASPKNEELITCALSELLACLMHHVFIKFKDEYIIAGVQHELKGAERVGPDTFVIFDGAYILVRMNYNNSALQNYDNIYRLWLCLLRHYPTCQQQLLYNFNLNRLNGQLKQLFEMVHEQVLDDSSVLFLELLEEMFLLELMPLSKDQLTDLVVKHLNEEQNETHRIRVVLACTSLYLSYAILKGHVPNLLLYFLKEILTYRNKVSPPINSLRCFLYLTLTHYILTCPNATDAYHLLSAPFNGNFIEWFEPFLSSMQYVSSKEVSKLNAAGIIKAMGDIGVKNYGQMLLTSREGQYPMDSLLRVITAKLDAIPEPNKYQQENMYINIIPNDMTPYLGLVKMKKVRLQFQNPVVKQILEQDLRPAFRDAFSGVFRELDWGADDLQERVGYGTAVSISNLLGWEIPNLNVHH